MKICMVSSHEINDPRAWSGTPYSLYCALRDYPNNEIETVDLSAYHTAASKRLHAVRHLDLVRSLRAHAPVSRLGLAYENPLNSSILHRVVKHSDADVVLELGGYMPSKHFPPYYIYSDSTHDLLLDFYAQQGHPPFGRQESDMDNVRRAAEYVRPIYRNAQGIFCMSQWMADSLIHTTGVSADRIHVVYAGSNWHGLSVPENHPRTLCAGKTIHLILVGVSYLGKGVDLAVAATELLNRESDTQYVLHVCGVREDFPHPDCVINHGFVDKPALSELLGQSDLFVLPSRFDCFGIAFAEAMAYGLPCIGRNICAMPEIIDAGQNGELVTGDDPQELASLIRKICGSAETYRQYSENALKKTKQFTWENVVDSMMQCILRERA